MVDEVVALLRALGSPRPQVRAACNALESRLAELGPRQLAAVRDGQARLLSAIRDVHARSLEPTRRAWLELYGGQTLVDLGCYEGARDLLEGWVGAADPGTGVQGRRFRAQAWVLLAEVDYVLGLSRPALEAAERGIAAGEAVARNAPAQEAALATAICADGNGVLGQVYAELGLVTEAARRIGRQAELARQSGDSTALRKAHVARAELYFSQGRPRRALRLVERLRAADPGSSVPELALIEGLALVVLGRDDPAAARRAERVLRGCLKRGGISHSLRVRALIGLVRTLLRGDEPAAADRPLRELRSLLAAAPGPGGAMFRVELESLAARRLRQQSACAPLAESVLRGQLERLAAAVGAVVEEGRQLPSRRGGVGFLTQRYRREVVSELILLAELVEPPERAAERAVDAVLALQTLGSSARELGAETMSVADVRDRLLPAGQGVLVFLASDGHSHLLALDHERVEHWLLSPWGETAPRANALRAALESPDARGPELLRRSRELAELVLPAGARARLRAWSVVTVADYGVLRGVPLECLVLDGDRPCGEEVAVNTLSSLPVGVKLLERRKTVPADRAGVDVLATLQGAGRLLGGKARSGARPFTEDELRPLWRGFADHRACLGNQLTARALRQWSFRGPLTEIVAHGAAAGSGERRRGLALAPEGQGNGFFGCKQADALRSVRGLVVLSACGSGLGALRIGDEGYYSTLGGAFLRAGAHTVVQSAGSPRLAEQLALIAHFHAGLLRGAPPAEALRRARAELAGEGGVAARMRRAQVQVFGLGQLPLIVPAKAGR